MNVQRVGVYVDGYNLYYGGRALCGRGAPGWRWLDVRGVVESVVRTQGSWANAQIERLVYCTARVDAVTSPDAFTDQDVYLKALLAAGSVDWIEYGNYVSRTKNALLAVEDPKTRRPVVQTSTWPVLVQDSQGQAVRAARFMVKYLHLEEKGSDVNLATHLLLDVMDERIDAAVVISNDSDLALPLRSVRGRIPVGLINPRGGATAGALRGQKTDGVGSHWWWTLQHKVLLEHQLPDPCGSQRKPNGW